MLNNYCIVLPFFHFGLIVFFKKNGYFFFKLYINHNQLSAIDLFFKENLHLIVSCEHLIFGYGVGSFLRINMFISYIYGLKLFLLKKDNFNLSIFKINVADLLLIDNNSFCFIISQKKCQLFFKINEVISFKIVDYINDVETVSIVDIHDQIIKYYHLKEIL